MAIRQLRLDSQWRVADGWGMIAYRVMCFAVVMAIGMVGVSGARQVYPERDAADERGFVPIFDGRTLDGWDGDPAYWSVADGCLVGEVTTESLLERNSFIVWQGGRPADFELKLDVRISAKGNSGINYRSELVDGIPHALRGYQADIDGAGKYTGQNYEERGRTFLALRGDVSRADPGGKVRVVGSTGDKQHLLEAIDDGGWNEVHLVVRGHTMVHMVNGQVMSVVVDDDPERRKGEGMIGVQVHTGPPMKVEYRNIRLKELVEEAAAPSPRWQPWDGVQSINKGWKYIESDGAEPPSDLAAAVEVNLPHTWNARDTLENKGYRRGASWYLKEFEISGVSAPRQARWFLRCGAAGQVAEVFLNGKHLGGHVGGYAAFGFELTEHLVDGPNQLAIRVSNAHDRMCPPLSGDFNFYGGLYRGVSLIPAPEVCFARDEQAGPGVRVSSPWVSAESASVRVESVLSNGGAVPFAGSVTVELCAPDGRVVSQAGQAVTIDAGGESAIDVTLPAVRRPLLWSPESPALYTVRLVLNHGGVAVDEVRVRHGFRWFRFTPDDGCFLNGQPYRLIGVNRHQDREGFGNALSDAQHDEDLRLIKELGANYLRLAHYQQDDYVLQRCDELGILVQEEVPYVNETTFEPAFEENLRTMMREMIAQHFNHPSIIVWGMGNEVWMKDRGDGKARCYDLIQRLNDLVHQLDPARKTLFVVSDTDNPSQLGVMGIPDIIGYNLYHGWYGRDIRGFKPRAEALHRLNPDKPLIVTEFGAGSDRRLHSVNPRRYDFTEDYQVEFLEGHLDQMDEMPWLAGFNWWAMADFGSSHRGDSIPHVNQKGLVTFNRERKDAYYLWKARFSDEPVLRIQSSAWVERAGPVDAQIRVITNLKEVELLHQSDSLGSQTKGFRWSVKLQDGHNVLVARGTDAAANVHEHRVEFEYVGEKKLPKVTCSKTRSLPENLVDGLSHTQWFARGPKAWIEIDLETPWLIDGLVLEPFDGEKRSYQLKVSGKATEGGEWELLWEGNTERGKTFRIPQDRQQEWRLIRIDGIGNDQNNAVSLSELMIEKGTEKQEKSLYERLGSGEGP